MLFLVLCIVKLPHEFIEKCYIGIVQFLHQNAISNELTNH